MSRSLGVLTIDLVARTGGFVQGMDKAQRESAKWRRQVQRDMQQIGRYAAVASAAVIAGVGAIVTQSVRAADEARKTAQAIGLTTEAYTGLSFAASQSGLSQQDVATSMRSLSRSAVEAAQGVETYASVYRNLGVQVKDSNGELRANEEILDDLADAFQAMPNGAEKSATAMKILGDSGARMIPMLNQGADGIRALTEQAQALGLVVSDRTAQQAELFNDSLAVMGALSKGLGNQISANLLPTMSSLAAEMAEVATEGNLTQGIADNLSFAMRGLAASAVGVHSAFRLAGRSIGGLSAVAETAMGETSWVDALSPVSALRRVVGNWGQARDQIGDVVDDISGEAERLGGLINRIMDAGQSQESGNAAAERVREMAQALADARAAAERAAAAQREYDESIKRSEGIDRQIESLQLQADMVNLTARQQALHRLSLEGASEAQLALADSILSATEAMERQNEAQLAGEAMRAAQAQEFSAVAEGLRTQEEIIEESYARRREIILANTQDTSEAQTELLTRLEQERQEQLGELNNDYWSNYLAAAQTAMESMDEMVGDVLNRFAGGMGDAFEAMIFDAESLEDAVTGLAENMARSVINALGQMAAQWLAYQAVQMLTARTSEAASAAAAAATGTAIASAYAPAAAMASLATMGANSAPAMAGIAATTSMAQSMSLMGMAHDGIDSVPQTGTWLLQKGERVTTAETSAKLDSMLDDIRTSGGARGSVNQTINVTGSVDKKTANQIATSTERKQRMASRRLG